MDKRSLRFGAVAALVLAVALLVGRVRRPSTKASETEPRATPSTQVDPAYPVSIQPLFDRRCVPCHGCFDSPCQLTLQSFEGLDRGGNRQIVYQPERPLEAKPTRMFQDARTTASWQSEFGFFPVVDRSHGADLAGSILWRFVAQRAAEPRAGSFDVDSTTACPSTAALVDKELKEHPERGMPFGFPALEQSELAALGGWLRRGAGAPTTETEPLPEALARRIAEWESFFNGPDSRAPLVSAYLFEHLFYAHLYFEDVPGEWFRIVRSRAPSGAVIDEIVTRRPYDDPGHTPFYYRVQRIRETLVEKTHAPFELSPAKLARFRQLFYEEPWDGAGPWLYDRRHAGNPFIAFAAIPARARYRFLLDDARYHVQTFIHGPVCRGQAALDVIDEQFLIFFTNPDSDPTLADARHLAELADELVLPAEKGPSIQALSPGFEAKELTYERKAMLRLKSRTFADVWHGDGTSPAVLTVFRHYDSAFVLRGALGGMPKTVWMLDYPIFERMYYDLVAGFDVYGNVTHQLGTRIYMNFLRIEAEGQFLRFLPVSERHRLLDEWYRNRVARSLVSIHDDAYAGPETGVVFANEAQAKQELVLRLLSEELPPAVAGPREPIQWPDVPFSSEPLRARFERAARELVLKPGPAVARWPDTVLLRLKGAGDENLVYTIARNRSHRSVEFIVNEGVELEPAEDYLQIVSGIAASRPNFFLSVDEARLEEFVTAWKALGGPSMSWGKFVASYGVGRSDPNFWRTFDFFTDTFRTLDPLGAATLDLSRYTND